MQLILLQRFSAMASSASATCSAKPSCKSSPTLSTRISQSQGPGRTTTPREGGSGRFFGDYVNWERIDGYRHAALHGPLPQLARTLLGETPRFFHEHILVKERDTSEITPWHHDEPYYCVDGASNVSLWVSLDPVPRQAGVEFIVGSHLWGRRFVPRKFVDHTSYVDGASGFELVPDIEPVRDQHEIVSFDVEPGDVIAFHYRTLHSAPGTLGRTTTRRRAASFRYSAAMPGSPPAHGCTRLRTSRSHQASRSTTSASRWSPRSGTEQPCRRSSPTSPCRSTVTSQGPAPTLNTGLEMPPSSTCGSPSRTAVDTEILEGGSPPQPGRGVLRRDITATAASGAVVMGRRLFDTIDGPDGWSEDMGYGAQRVGDASLLRRHPLPAAGRPPGAGPGHAIHVRARSGDRDRSGSAAATHGDVVIMGGGDVIGQALEKGIVDQFRVHLAPLVLGRGTPLFRSGDHDGSGIERLRD